MARPRAARARQYTCPFHLFAAICCRGGGGGIAISGLPAHQVEFNGIYAPTGALVEGFPSYAAGPTRHLFHDPKTDQWILSDRPFNPVTTVGLVWIAAAAGPVPSGARGWQVWYTGARRWVDAEVAAREVA